MKPEAILLIHFLTPDEGGRETPIEGDRYGCPIMINDNQGFDCRFVLDGHTIFELGDEYEIPVKFLNPEKALKNLQVGKEVFLWEGKKIGLGTVKEILVSTDG